MNRSLRSTDTGVRGVAHPSFSVAVVLEQAAKKKAKAQSKKKKRI